MFCLTTPIFLDPRFSSKTSRVAQNIGFARGRELSDLELLRVAFQEQLCRNPFCKSGHNQVMCIIECECECEVLVA